MRRLTQVIAIAAFVGPANAARPGPAPNVLTPVKLVQRIDEAKGRTVTVRGYFTYVADTRALWQDRGSYLDAKDQRRGEKVDYWAKCITIYPRNGAVSRFDGHHVRITGRATIIDKDDLRSLWTCNQVALEEAVITAE